MTTEPVPPAPADRHGLVGALLVLVGIGWLLDAGGVGVPWRALLPAALIAVGLACVAGAFQGRQHAMMVVGVVLTAVLAVASAADWDLDVPLAGGIGDRTERPATPAELTSYELGAGDFLLDLRQLQVPPGTTEVKARVGVGELVVEVPDGVTVRVVASSGLGEVQVLGEQENGSPTGSTPPPRTAATVASSWTSGSASARSGWNGEPTDRAGGPVVAGCRGAVRARRGAVPAGRARGVEAADRLPGPARPDRARPGRGGQRLAAAPAPPLRAQPAAARPAAISPASPALASSRARLATRLRPPVRRCSQSSSNGVRALPKTAASRAAAAPSAARVPSSWGSMAAEAGGSWQSTRAPGVPRAWRTRISSTTWATSSTTCSRGSRPVARNPGSRSVR